MFKRDASDVVTSSLGEAPGGWETRRLIVAAAVLAVLAAAALVVDLPIARFIREEGLPGDVRRLVRLGEVFGYGGTVALIIAAAATLDRRGWPVAVQLAIPSFGAGLLADGLKLVVARLRPSAANLAGDVLETFVGWLPLAHAGSLGQAYGYALQSFPSAHAATAAGLAASLAGLYPRGGWLFVVFALLAGVQRIEAQAHFASDVLAGGALGCLVAVAAAIAGPIYPAPRAAGLGEVK